MTIQLPQVSDTVRNLCGMVAMPADRTRSGSAWLGTARRGMAVQGPAWPGRSPAPERETVWGLLLEQQGVAAPVELPLPSSDGKRYVTTALGARLLGVAECTISSWKQKGYIQPVAGSPPRRPLYLWDDLVEGEYKARAAAIEASGTDKQVRRDRDADAPVRRRLRRSR